MGLYNFQERFVPFIQDGSKTHTIRTIRKHPQKVGALMHLFYGLRTKFAKRIIQPQLCTAVKTIFIFEDKRVLIYPKIMTTEEAQDFIKKKKRYRYKKYMLDLYEENHLAWNDGFRFSDKEWIPMDFGLMMKWWKQTHELPFAGHIQYWK